MDGCIVAKHTVSIQTLINAKRPAYSGTSTSCVSVASLTTQCFQRYFACPMRPAWEPPHVQTVWQASTVQAADSQPATCVHGGHTLASLGPQARKCVLCAFPGRIPLRQAARYRASVCRVQRVHTKQQMACLSVRHATSANSRHRRRCPSALHAVQIHMRIRLDRRLAWRVSLENLCRKEEAPRAMLAYHACLANIWARLSTPQRRGVWVVRLARTLMPLG